MKTRFNYLAYKINDRVARTLSYKGVVVDLGCGTAPFKEFILRSADKYIGVDWPASAHDRKNVDISADICKPIPLDDASADTVVSFQVLEHLSEPSQFLSECRRLLKPGGMLLLTVSFMWHVHESPHDYFRYTRYGLTHMLTQADFVNITIKENTGFWQTMALKFNYHTARWARGPLGLIMTPFWLAGQIIAPVLDRIDFNPGETASYTVTARKPGDHHAS